MQHHALQHHRLRGAGHLKTGLGCRIVARSVSGTVTETAPGLRSEPWTGAPAQEQALQQLRARMAASPLGCPDEATLKWYLRDRYFDLVEAEQKLTSMLKWRRQLGPPGSISATSVASEAASGKAYIADHPDKYGRPAIVIKAARHVTGEFPLADSKRYCAYLLDQAVARLPPNDPSREQIVGLFDLRGFSPRNADFGFAAFMVDAFFEYYPRRVGQVLFVDAPWVFKPAYDVIKPLLRKYQALVQFADRQQARQLFLPGQAPSDFQ